MYAIFYSNKIAGNVGAQDSWETLQCKSAKGRFLEIGDF